MADFTVSDGTDWLQTLAFGGTYERWRLDDYDLYLQVKTEPGEAAEVKIEATTANGKLVIADPVARRLDINVSWSEVEAAGPGPFIFDVLFVNRTTDLRHRSERHTLTITQAVTYN